MKNPKILSGSISEIIDDLENANGGVSVTNLSVEQKLTALCKAVKLTPDQLDSLIAENPNVLRSVKGHVFEAFFDTLIAQSGYKSEIIGGDGDIDRKVNGRTLQLKTPYEAGTSGEVVQFKTHKTHGAKSERESMEYYHDIDSFAEYLVGLVSYNPLNILILKRDELPTHPKDKKRIASPFKINNWGTHPALNAFERLGIRSIRETSAIYKIKGKEAMPLSSEKLGIPTDILLNTILMKSNFRVWDMLIRGMAVEIAFSSLLENSGVLKLKPDNKYRTDDRANKSDLVLVEEKNYCFVQVKGVSIRQCNFRNADPVIGVETQLTRGRVSDDPTLSRLYLKTDFALLVLGLTPTLANQCRANIGLEPVSNWEFYAIPTEELRTHSKFSNRINAVQKIRYSQLEIYKIDKKWLSKWNKR